MRELSQLRWQCRRGMRELDILLTRYLEGPFAASSAEEKGAFYELIALSDPDLAGYLLRNERSNKPLQQRVVATILGRDPA